MSQQTINLGAAADDDTGDSLRVGGGKINDNFTEIYTAAGPTPLLRGISREVWIAVGTPGDDAIGDARNPFRVETAAQFDALMVGFAAPAYRVNGQVIPIRIHLGPGTFLTNGQGFSDENVDPGPPPYTGSPTYFTWNNGGWVMYKGWEIEGCGPGVTTLKCVAWPQSAYYGAGYPGRHSVIQAQWALLGHETGYTAVRNLTVDANWSGLTGKPAGANYAMAGVQLYDNHCRIENVEVTGVYGGVINLIEDFPLFIGHSNVINAPYLTEPAYGYPDFTNPGGDGAIRNCCLSGANGAYNCGMVIFAEEDAPASVIENCIVHGPNIFPSAYQIIGSGRVYGCQAYDVASGFSIDTGPLRDVIVERCRFRGITVLGVGFRDVGVTGSRIMVLDNFIEVVTAGAAGVGTQGSPVISDLLVSGNIFQCSGAPTTSQAINIAVSTGVRIERNLIRSALTSTINAAVTPFFCRGNLTPTFGVPAGLPNNEYFENYRAKTATYSVASDDSFIDCTSGTFTVTLPTAVGAAGRQITIKNSGAGTITIATVSAQTIDGAATKSLAVQYASATVVSDGANWKVR